MLVCVCLVVDFFVWARWRSGVAADAAAACQAASQTGIVALDDRSRIWNFNYLNIRFSVVAVT